MGDIADINGIVYQIICLKNGREYIGSTLDFDARKRGHLYLLRHNKHHSLHLQRAFKKYGEKYFEFSILEAGILAQNLIETEAQFIRQRKPEFNADMPHPTRRGSKQSDACKAKVSAANKGRKQSPETRAKIGLASKGNKNAVGNQNALKISPTKKREIDNLRTSGLGCRKIAKIIGVNKTTILNVFNSKYGYGVAI